MVFTFTNIRKWIIDADDETINYLAPAVLGEKQPGWFYEKEKHHLVYTYTVFAPLTWFKMVQ